MSALPPKAVEAMARAVFDARKRRNREMGAESTRVWGHPGAVTHVAPLSVAEELSVALAALPDGVYVVRGGQVAYRTEEEVWRAFGLKDRDDVTTLHLTPQTIFAALSATDTEKAGE